MEECQDPQVDRHPPKGHELEFGQLGPTRSVPAALVVAECPELIQEEVMCDGSFDGKRPGQQVVEPRPLYGARIGIRSSQRLECPCSRSRKTKPTSLGRVFWPVSPAALNLSGTPGSYSEWRWTLKTKRAVPCAWLVARKELIATRECKLSPRAPYRHLDLAHPSARE